MNNEFIEEKKNNTNKILIAIIIILLLLLGGLTYYTFFVRDKEVDKPNPVIEPTNPIIESTKPTEKDPLEDITIITDEGEALGLIDFFDYKSLLIDSENKSYKDLKIYELYNMYNTDLYEKTDKKALYAKENVELNKFLNLFDDKDIFHIYNVTGESLIGKLENMYEYNYNQFLNSYNSTIDISFSETCKKYGQCFAYGYFKDLDLLVYIQGYTLKSNYGTTSSYYTQSKFIEGFKENNTLTISTKNAYYDMVEGKIYDKYLGKLLYDGSADSDKSLTIEHDVSDKLDTYNVIFKLVNGEYKFDSIVKK